MKKNNLKKAPFLNGDLLDYHCESYDYEWSGGKVEWRDNVPFLARMRVIGFERGRSAARLVLQDEAGHKYPMFMRDAVDLLQNATMENGLLLHLAWRVVKRGANYGLQAVV